jgi:hypothetical protein
MKYALSFLALVASTQAFAFVPSYPSYRCEPADSSLAPLIVNVLSAEQVSFATIVDGKEVPATTLKRDSSRDKQGYKAFFAVGGCNQNGNGPHCFAIWQNTLLLSSNISDGRSMKGAAELNGEQYRCEMLLKAL